VELFHFIFLHVLCFHIERNNVLKYVKKSKFYGSFVRSPERFFNGGGFDSCLRHCCAGDRSELRARAEALFSRLLPNLGGFNHSHPSIKDLYKPITFLPLEPPVLARAACFAGRVQDAFPAVHTITLLQRGALVWTGLQSDDAHTLYDYVANAILPRVSKSTGGSIGPSSGRESSSPFGGGRGGRFLVGGPPNVRGNLETMDWTTPSIWINASNMSSANFVLGQQKEVEEHKLIVYHALAATICLTVPAMTGNDLPDDFFRRQWQQLLQFINYNHDSLLSITF